MQSYLNFQHGIYRLDKIVLKFIRNFPPTTELSQLVGNRQIDIGRQTNRTEKRLQKQIHVFLEIDLIIKGVFQISRERVYSFLPALSGMSVTSHNFVFITLNTIQFPGSTGHMSGTQKPQMTNCYCVRLHIKNIFITAESFIGQYNPR